MDRNPETPKAKPAVRPAEITREDRLKAALKANMGRRKAQARARAAEPGEDLHGETTDSGTTREA